MAEPNKAKPATSKMVKSKPLFTDAMYDCPPEKILYVFSVIFLIVGLFHIFFFAVKSPHMVIGTITTFLFAPLLAAFGKFIAYTKHITISQRKRSGRLYSKRSSRFHSKQSSPFLNKSIPNTIVAKIFYGFAILIAFIGGIVVAHQEAPASLIIAIAITFSSLLFVATACFLNYVHDITQSIYRLAERNK